MGDPLYSYVFYEALLSTKAYQLRQRPSHKIIADEAGR